MTHFLLCLGSSLIAYLVLFGSTSGWGFLLLRFIKVQPASQIRFFLPWFGLCVILPLAEIAHIWIPMDWRVAVPLALAGLILYFLWQSKADIDFALRNRRVVLFGLAIATAVAWFAMDVPRNYDSGLYHFPTIRWLREFPLVPGLANLHARLATNQTALELIALADVSPFFGHGSNVVCSFLCLIVMAQSATIAACGGSYLRLAALLLGVAAIMELLTCSIASPAPDTAQTFLQYSIVLLVAWHIDQRRLADALIVLVPLTALSATFKFSGAILPFFLMISIGVALLRNGSQRQRIGRLAWAGTFAAAWGALWATRGVILSGYPVYPMSVGRFEFDWTVPLHQPEKLVSVIRWWARIGKEPPTEHWIPLWIQRYREDFMFVFPLGVFAAATLASARKGFQHLRPFLSIIVSVVVASIVWWIGAPDPRFGGETFAWILTVFILAAAILGNYANVERVRSQTIALFFTGVCLLGLTCVQRLTWIKELRWSITGPVRLGYRKLPTASMVTITNAEGLVVSVPAIGDQAWDAPLPNAPHREQIAHLQLRTGHIQDGFRTNPDLGKTVKELQKQ